jgi:hypothetical protein
LFDSSSLLEENEVFRPGCRLAEVSAEVPNAVYLEKLENLFSAATLTGVPPEPTRVTDGVYLGTQFNAENLALLKRHKFNCVVNCAGVPEGEVPRRQRAARYKDTGIAYEELPLDDTEYFNILSYFGQASSILDAARARGLKTLLFCPAVSRSGAVALAYLLKSTNTTLLKAARALKEDRRLVCCNSHFLAQLVEYARYLGRLDADPDSCWAPQYMRKLDHHRVRFSYMDDPLRTPYRDIPRL